MASRKFFGTDGVRGLVGEDPITPERVMKLGWAAGRVLGAGDGRGKIIVGKDTRVSGYLLESALESGFAAAGLDVYLLGPMPTPGIAYLTRTVRARAGVVISASHNPYEDNGIKFFSPEGTKLPDEVEAAIEDQMQAPLKCVAPAELGKAYRYEDARGRYIEFCKSTFPNRLNLRGLTIVVDCANGAAYHVAPDVLEELGARVIPIGTEPDGFNINAGCGSTAPDALRKAVVENRADLGIALDGDADRVVMVDGSGTLIDGDQLLYIIATSRRDAGRLSGGVAGTVMSNLGLELGLAARGIPFRRAKVGDRYVMETLHAEGWELGGESSGHIICLDKTTTGDGIIAALEVLCVVQQTGLPLAALAGAMEVYPQHMVNVRTGRSLELKGCRNVEHAVAEVEKALGSHGRVVLRPSGTEPVIRVMVEGRDAAEVRACAEQIAHAVKHAAAQAA